MAACHVQPEQFWNLIWGYNDQLLDSQSESSGNGTTTVASSAVPADEIWIVTGIACHHDDGTARDLVIRVNDGATTYMVAREAAVAQYVTLDRQGHWVLIQGDYIEGRALALGAGDTVYLNLCGYKMQIVQ